MITTPATDRSRISATNLGKAGYWITTIVLTTEGVVGGLMGVLQLSPFLETAIHLGYSG